MKMLKKSMVGIAVSLVELLIGILLLVDPVGFTSGIIIACGIGLMLGGIGSVIRYFLSAPEAAAVSQSLVKGLVALLAGAFCAFNSHWFLAAFPVLTLVYGIVILIVGLTKLQWTVDMIRLKRSRWYLSAISSVLSVVCGVVIITSPFSSTGVLWMFTGISLITEAVFDMIGGLFGNSGKKADRKPAQADA